ncbi:hypothetical protein PoB_004944300 [Plakobranchus ocellatus]|uniref:Uncharacterized protein n=1 Tax=Plakobranchus ocellatus TaxID=259542 RepID=A0AAV4BUR7_9GAST|nr:hypothetical protein PoB_004944300 [Plakobranchus ocellatus]
MYIPSPQQGDFRLSGLPSGEDAGGGARTRDRKIPADIRADSLATLGRREAITDQASAEESSGMEGIIGIINTRHGLWFLLILPQAENITEPPDSLTHSTSWLLLSGQHDGLDRSPRTVSHTVLAGYYCLDSTMGWTGASGQFHTQYWLATTVRTARVTGQEPLDSFTHTVLVSHFCLNSTMGWTDRSPRTVSHTVLAGYFCPHGTIFWTGAFGQSHIQYWLAITVRVARNTEQEPSESLPTTVRTTRWIGQKPSDSLTHSIGWLLLSGQHDGLDRSLRTVSHTVLAAYYCPDKTMDWTGALGRSHIQYWLATTVRTTRWI